MTDPPFIDAQLMEPALHEPGEVSPSRGAADGLGTGKLRGRFRRLFRLAEEHGYLCHQRDLRDRARQNRGDAVADERGELGECGVRIYVFYAERPVAGFPAGGIPDTDLYREARRYFLETVQRRSLPFGQNLQIPLPHKLESK
jgi:hypothetical protein